MIVSSAVVSDDHFLAASSEVALVGVFGRILLFGLLIQAACIPAINETVSSAKTAVGVHAFLDFADRAAKHIDKRYAGRSASFETPAS